MNTGDSDSSLYVRIDLQTKGTYLEPGRTKIINLEKKDDDFILKFLQNSVYNSGTGLVPRYYVCKEVKISSKTKRVYYMNFVEN